LKVAVLGGTGQLGSGLARRWALAGLSVIIGSRRPQSAADAAAALVQDLAGTKKPADVIGSANADAAKAADIVVLTVPFENQRALLEEAKPALVGKILIDATVPLVPPRVARVQLPAQGSAAQIAAEVLGEGVRVVSGFHNVAAEKLQHDEPIDCDVLIFGDDKAAREEAVKLANAAGLRGLHGGPLANSAAAEALTSVIIFLNKQYGGPAGIRLTGLDVK